MADDLRMALDELLRKAELERDVDVLREGVRLLSQALMELEVTHHVGAERFERTEGRTGQRNGYRERQWATRGGDQPAGAPGAGRQLLPRPAGAAQAGGAGPGGRGAGGLRAGRLNAPG